MSTGIGNELHRGIGEAHFTEVMETGITEVSGQNIRMEMNLTELLETGITEILDQKYQK